MTGTGGTSIARERFLSKQIVLLDKRLTLIEKFIEQRFRERTSPNHGEKILQHNEGKECTASSPPISSSEPKSLAVPDPTQKRGRGRPRKADSNTFPSTSKRLLPLPSGSASVTRRMKSRLVVEQKKKLKPCEVRVARLAPEHEENHKELRRYKVRIRTTGRKGDNVEKDVIKQEKGSQSDDSSASPPSPLSHEEDLDQGEINTSGPTNDGEEVVKVDTVDDCNDETGNKDNDNSVEMECDEVLDENSSNEELPDDEMESKKKQIGKKEKVVAKRKYMSATQDSIPTHSIGVVASAKKECPICHNHFKLEVFDAHVKAHVKERHLKCPNPSCEKSYFNMAMLNKHMRVHQPDKYGRKCRLCEKIFFQSDKLLAHERFCLKKALELEKQVDPAIIEDLTNRSSAEWLESISTLSAIKDDSPERKKCPVCNRSFKLMFYDRHVKSHGNKNWNCNICDKTYCHKHDLVRHIAIVHGANPTCELCEQSFKDGEELKSHLVACRKEHQKDPKVSTVAVAPKVSELQTEESSGCKKSEKIVVQESTAP